MSCPESCRGSGFSAAPRAEMAGQGGSLGCGSLGLLSTVFPTYVLPGPLPSCTSVSGCSATNTSSSPCHWSRERLVCQFSRWEYLGDEIVSSTSQGPGIQLSSVRLWGSFLGVVLFLQACEPACAGCSSGKHTRNQLISFPFSSCL